MKNLVITLLLLLVATPGRSQTTGCKNNWPSDKQKAEEQLEIYSEALKAGNYRAAVPGIQWFLKNAPNWNTKLYTDGTDVYNKLAAAEKDPSKKQVLIDSLMWMYDERGKQCGDEAAVLNRKATYAALYNGQNKDRTADVLVLFDRVLDISGDNVNDNVLDNYFRIVYANFMLLKNKNEDEIFAHYQKIRSAMDLKIAKYQYDNKISEAEKVKISKANAEALLPKMIPANCDYVKKNLEPKFRMDPANVSLAKKIVGFMSLGKCTNDSLFIQAGEVVNRIDPTKDFGLTKDLALRYLNTGNTQKAFTYSTEAVGLAKSKVEKSEAFMVVGSVQMKMNQNQSARDSFKQAVAADPIAREPYEKLGDLYAAASDCGNLNYLAAWLMYSKAESNAKMIKMKSLFPTKEEITKLKMKPGEKKSTGCWINENVTIETRD